MKNKASNLIQLKNNGIRVPDFIVINHPSEFDITLLDSSKLYSVRSAPSESMPGILKSILNVGFSDIQNFPLKNIILFYYQILLHIMVVKN